MDFHLELSSCWREEAEHLWEFLDGRKGTYQAIACQFAKIFKLQHNKISREINVNIYTYKHPPYRLSWMGLYVFDIR